MKRCQYPLSAALLLAAAGGSAETIRPIEFPVDGQPSFSDDFNAGRDNNTRPHEGIDILAPKMTPAVSAVVNYRLGEPVVSAD